MILGSVNVFDLYFHFSTVIRGEECRKDKYSAEVTGHLVLMPLSFNILYLKCVVTFEEFQLFINLRTPQFYSRSIKILDVQPFLSINRAIVRGQIPCTGSASGDETGNHH